VSRRLRRALLAGLLLVGAARVRAQGYAAGARPEQILMGVGWAAAVPQRGLADFVDKTSFRAFDAELRYAPRRLFSLGLASGWSWIAQARGQGRLELPQATISGNLYRRVQLFRLEVDAHVYLLGGAVQPYLGIGGGPLWSQEYQQVGEVVKRQSAVQLAWNPQLGLLWTFRPGLALQAQAAWHLTSAHLGSARRAEWLGLRLGLAAY